MTVILRIIEVVLGLLALATISVVVFLRRPDWSPFQEQTFGSNVIPVAMMVAAWTTLLVAYAAFRTIRSNREKEERDRKERLLNEIIEWATSIAELIVTRLTHPNTNSEAHWLLMYAGFDSKSEYMVTIAANISGSDLVSYVKRIRECLKYGIWITGKSIDIEDHTFFIEFPWSEVAEEPPVPRELQTAGIKVLPKLDELLRTYAIILMKKAAEIKTKNVG